MGELFKMAQTPIPMYRGLLVLIVSDDRVKVENITTKDYGTSMYAHACVINFNGKEAHTIILNPNNSGRKLHYGTVCHEIFHAVGGIALNRGIQPDWNNDEPMAYLCDWIADFVFSNLKKWNIELKTI